MTARQLGQLTIDDGGLGVPAPGTDVLVSGADALFEHTRTDSLGRYRPLSGAKTLPTGWRAEFNECLSADCAIEVVYPLALTHQRQFAQGALRVVSLEEVLSRQSGRYEEVASLSERGRALAIETVCGKCVRRPVWSGASCPAEDIPCPEPCSVLVAFCREATIWQSERPSPSPPDPTVAWAAFDVPGNELREAYLSQSQSDV